MKHNAEQFELQLEGSKPIDFKPDWKLHRICPVCNTESIMGCRCPLSDQVCKNGHSWHMCPIHHKTVLGDGNHNGDTFRCRCDETATYRTK